MLQHDPDALHVETRSLDVGRIGHHHRIPVVCPLSIRDERIVDPPLAGDRGMVLAGRATICMVMVTDMADCA